MYSPRKIVRDAVRTALQHDTSGLNAKLALVTAEFGIPLMSFSWEVKSKQFLQGFFIPEAVELSQIFQFPGLILYTSPAQSADGREKYRTFTGDVTANLDFYLQFREGMEFDDTESQGEALEGALLATLVSCRPILEGAGAYWNGDISITPAPVIQLENGWSQNISISLTFEVII